MNDASAEKLSEFLCQADKASYGVFPENAPWGLL